MEMFVGKPYSKKDSAPDVELLFFDLIEKTFDELLDLYNDYLDLYKTFDDFEYKKSANLVMASIRAKGGRNRREQEVNVS